MMLNRPFLLISAILFIVTAVAVCFKPDAGNFESSKEAIVMRSIGHQILLSAGDSTSRVLPVAKSNDHEYQIQFEQALTFKTDSVIKIIKQAITANHLPPDYVVNVVNSRSNQVIYGFAVLKTEQASILPCKGRWQPKANYTVRITFRNTGTLNKSYVVGTGGGLAALLLIFSGLGLNRRQQKIAISQELPSASPAVSPLIAIGNYKFFPGEQYLELNKERVKLSDKEHRVLLILAQHMNTVVGRNDLQKIWEDDGVIVGRSLDVFISKLRRKLEQDPEVRLVNVHGKGYKLEAD